MDLDLLALGIMDSRDLHRVSAAIGVTNFTLYGFRRTVATLHLHTAAPLTFASEWLNHSAFQLSANADQHLSEVVSREHAESHL